ncbi:hypothetical protein VTK56DRAFT_8771 [Thermocarpiscus australiensis]
MLRAPSASFARTAEPVTITIQQQAMTTATMSAASLIFLIIYNVFYYFLYLLTFAFLVITPIDLVQQAAHRRQNYDILTIALCYVVTTLVVAFIYATRLYINRSVLGSIPKSWIPIEKGDVPRDVRQMIVEGLSRSAAIAYEARPRFPPVVPIQQPPTEGGTKQESPASGAPPLWLSGPKTSPLSDGAVAIDLPQQLHKPVWGEIEHPGWAPPTSPDLPNLHYDAVVLELPNLIEAKALTLAPPDPESHTEPPALDADAVALLQRPECMGLREYLMYLTDLAVLAPLPATSVFLAKYEAARFSARPLSGEQFRSLMHLFAEILRNMHPLSPAALARYEGDSSSSGRGASESDNDIDDDAPRGGTTSPSSSGTHHRAPQAKRSGDGSNTGIVRSGSSSTASSRRVRGPLVPRNTSANTWQFRTAPTTPKSKHAGLSGVSSSDGFAQAARHPYPASPTSSASSLRSAGGASVIRLARSEEAVDLPYVLTYSPSQ